MIIKKIIYCLILGSLSFTSQIAMSAENASYSLIRIDFDEHFSLDDAVSMSLDMESARLISEKRVKLVVNQYELKKAEEAGAKLCIIIEDLEEYYSKRLQSNKIVNPGVLGADHFSLGTMGGYYTLEEIYVELERMRIVFTEYFRSYEIIGYSIEDRPIYAYHFGAPAGGTAPEVLLTACHHAREPGSISVLVYFLWKLLESAASGDKNAQHLLENRSICIIPCLNPDGYEFNRLNRPLGGGMWRKNRRHIRDSVYGVDLNRNYGPREFWDADNNGSSTEPQYENYRGKEPFSEPETEALRDFVKRRNFKIALNYHTYGDLIIHPYSALQKETPDSMLFRYMCADATRENLYNFGRDFTTVGYIGRGTSDDWFYRTEPDKPKILALTPEAGNDFDGFWPEPDRLIQICRDNFQMIYKIVRSAGKCLRPADPRLINENGSYFVSLKIRNIGLEIENTASIEMKSLQSNFSVVDSIMLLPGINSVSELSLKLRIAPNGKLDNGEIVPFEFTVIQNNVRWADTFELPVFRMHKMALFENPTDTSLWRSSGSWGIEFDEGASSYMLSDSPDSVYANSYKNYIRTKESIDIRNCNSANLEFNTKWNIDWEYDVGVVEISTNGGSSWQNLRSSRMRQGIGHRRSNFDTNMFGFSGNYPLWVHQRINLDDFIGNDILLRFGLLSDKYKAFEGWLLKDVYLNIFEDVSRKQDHTDYLLKMKCFPNPVNGGEKFFLEFYSEKDYKANWQIIDIFGRILKSGNFEGQRDIIRISSGSPGVYFIRLQSEGREMIEKLIVY